ncbi:hypothetical protein DYB37_008884 [Aphanomyces astaci]|uniref:Uncharacterized protein n=1 Tax=Aphanomyces astaci TaxID=112090 RepID=A0A3R6ZGH7_APHAT|nr:hypothetical protein DYB35_008197 [Aphanomyces astaci]RHZ06689.1 hypothetical protein DYB37_008884 [Aphanomyces astaci]
MTQQGKSSVQPAKKEREAKNMSSPAKPVRTSRRLQGLEPEYTAYEKPSRTRFGLSTDAKEADYAVSPLRERKASPGRFP